MYYVEQDGSVIDANGRIIFFSLTRFVKDIVQGNHCFMCGISPQERRFNDEHVVPDWILRRYRLHDKNITLPNGTSFPYGQFKIPCCEECNRRLGKSVETPVSAMFAKGYRAFADGFKNEGPWRLFCWMCLLFLKTHLKDIGLPLHRDRRKGDAKIGELHSWEELHHIHCMARSFYTGGNMRPEVLGSLIVIPAKDLPYCDHFDYGDLSFAQTMFLRLDDIAVIAVLDDSQACWNVIQAFIKNISGPLSPPQLRELVARMAEINIRLAERPRFVSTFDVHTDQYEIGCDRPTELRVEEFKEEILGKLMRHLCSDVLPDDFEKPNILTNIKTGRYSFVFDDQGNFASNHMDPIE